MKYTWRKKYSFEIGTAMPIDPQPNAFGHWKYIRCPLCFIHCTDHYWEHWHSKKLHGQCPICNEWFVLPNGIGQHLARSQCGILILEAIDRSIDNTVTVTINVAR